LPTTITRAFDGMKMIYNTVVPNMNPWSRKELLLALPMIYRLLQVTKRSFYAAEQAKTPQAL
jgi:hypothetical protein